MQWYGQGGRKNQCGLGAWEKGIRHRASVNIASEMLHGQDRHTQTPSACKDVPCLHDCVAILQGVGQPHTRLSLVDIMGVDTRLLTGQTAGPAQVA